MRTFLKVWKGITVKINEPDTVLPAGCHTLVPGSYCGCACCCYNVSCF
ncbi:MAG: hypothetical protein HXS47_14050 [Theionarchaea archaeon]|nr:hypothetical protein [Theionarchaea archaeon]